MTMDFEPGWTRVSPGPDAVVAGFCHGRVVTVGERWLLDWPEAQPALAEGTEPVHVGQLGHRPVYVVELAEDRLPGAAELVALRDALLFQPDAPAELLGTAFQVQQWFQDHRFCGRCGQQTGFHSHERARWCGSCEIPWYPRLAPCVIVVIRRGDRFLLARSTRMKQRMFSLIAGFVEAGESVESAVQREVLEETGLRVSNVRYQASQPWPFPHQLMLGFFADYDSGDLVLQEDELVEADWYHPDSLPPVPPPTTIAGRLIAAMIAELRAESRR